MRGFTLIELLAVIVILSIILLISVPIINGIIEETKKSAFESSAKGYMESAKNLYVTNSLAGISEDTVVTFTEGVPSNMKIEMSGGTPKSGTIVIYKTGSLEFALYDGVYCATKNISSNDITVSKKVEADCIIELPELTLIGDANIDLDTGSFEHYCNGALVRSGKMSAASMATLGSTVKIVLINGNYTSQTATYRNIKIEVK